LETFTCHTKRIGIKREENRSREMRKRDSSPDKKEMEDEN